MKLIANRQLVGSYGTVAAGGVFEADGETAKQLIGRGLARSSDSGSDDVEDCPALVALRKAVTEAAVQMNNFQGDR